MSDSFEFEGDPTLNPGDIVVTAAEETVQEFSVIMQEVIISSTSTGGSDTADDARQGTVHIFGGISDFVSSIEQLPGVAATDSGSEFDFF